MTFLRIFFKTLFESGWKISPVLFMIFVEEEKISRSFAMCIYLYAYVEVMMKINGDACEQKYEKFRHDVIIKHHLVNYKSLMLFR